MVVDAQLKHLNGPMNDLIYEWSDAWLLLAIIYASRHEPATLAKVIAAGDAINHAIFTPAELDQGLARLSRGGYVDEFDGTLVPLTKAFEYQVTDRKPRQWLDELRAVQEMLNVREF